MKTFINRVNLALGSSRLSIAIIILLVAQALFLAVFTTWVVFDERFHFGLTDIYTNHLWPVIYNQPTSYDLYRDLAGEGSRLYQFLMSIPLRGIGLFSQDTILQLKLLRIINVAMFAYGMWWFFKLFDSIHISRRISNLAMFVFAMIPTAPWIAGSVNYDNFIFMLTPLFLYFVIKILFSKRIAFDHLAILVAIGLLASLSKFTFIPIFGMSVLLILANIILRWRRGTLLFNGFSSRWKPISLGAIIAILLMMFIQTYVVNFVKYGTPRPDCQQTLGLDRCLSNSVISHNEEQRASKDDRRMIGLVEYSTRWFQQMMTTATFTAAQPDRSVPASVKDPMPVIYLLHFTIFVIVLASTIRFSSMKDRKIIIMVGISVAFIMFILFTGYLIYGKYHAYRAIQARYILPELLMLIVVGLHYAQNWFIGKNLKYGLITAYVLLAALYTQGGGALTYVMNSNQDWYWNRDVGDAIKGFQESYGPFINEPNPTSRQ